MSIRVAGAQILSTYDVKANYIAVARGIEYAAAEKADVLLTPEGSLSGYYSGFNRGEVAEATNKLVRLAAQTGVGLALGTCFTEDDGRCYNELRFYDGEGRFLGFHAKILLCGNPEDLTRGECREYATKPLGTFRVCDETVGGLICNDLWANPEWTPLDDPHLTRRLAAMGTKVVFHAVNSGADEPNGLAETVRAYHESNLRIRARASKLWIVTANCCYESGPCSCTSGVVGPDGQWKSAAPREGEQFFAYTIP